MTENTENSLWWARKRTRLKYSQAMQPDKTHDSLGRPRAFSPESFSIQNVFAPFTFERSAYSQQGKKLSGREHQVRGR